MRTKQNKIWIYAASFLLLVTVSPLGLWAQKLDGRAVMKLVDGRPDGSDRRSQIKMTLINKRGQQRVRAMLSYSKDYDSNGTDKKSIFYFEQPADVRGTGFLTWSYDNLAKDDDRWLYLPALKSSRRISGSSKNDYFMGSDLTYDDMGGRSLDEDIHKLLREEKIDNQDCWVVESTPKDKKDMYSKVISYVRKDALVIVRADFYDRQGSLLKVMKNFGIEKVQGFWINRKMEMENVQTKHKTLFETESIKFNLGLSDSMFRVSTLERGHLK